MILQYFKVRIQNTYTVLLKSKYEIIVERLQCQNAEHLHSVFE